jgi:GDP-mannose 6-dehydrogenase
LNDLETAARAVGERVRERAANLAPLLIVVRSTILPGTMAGRIAPIIEAAAGEGPGGRYQLAYNPEFMREGSAIADFRAPSRIVIGGAAGAAGPLLEVYRHISAPRFETSFEVAEAIKFADNGFHALKVAFANEIGRFALSHGIDPAALAALFVADTKLNISPQYLAPGLGFGGPCLPKDLRALVADLERSGAGAPLLGNVLASNQRHEDFLVEQIAGRAGRDARVLLLGLTAKANSSDLRGSPLASLARRLVGEGYDLAILDPDLSDARLVEEDLRSRLVDSPSPAAAWDFVIIGKSLPGVADALAGVPSINLFRLGRAV